MKVSLTQAEIDAVFETAESASDYVVAFFSLVCDKAGIDWEKVESIDHYPMVNPETSRYMMQQAIQTDQRLLSSAMPGGSWMNYGFSSTDGSHLAPWVVCIDPLQITLKP